MKTSHIIEQVLVKGDLVRFMMGDHKLGIYLGPYTSINQKTGEQYVCAEMLWLDTNRVGTAAFSTLEIVREAV